MIQDSHHIRLLASFEIEPGAAVQRCLERADCQTIAAALAADIARVVGDTAPMTLVVGGGLLEPSELLRPEFPAWRALAELAEPAIRQSGLPALIMGIGAHQGRLPDRRLAPPDASAQGHLLALPMLLVTTGDGAELAAKLEAELFERGGIAPPARALLAEHAALASAHGQLLTLADLIALQHVQMDTAGLGPFWPLVETALLAEPDPQSVRLPADVAAAWDPEALCWSVSFLSFDEAQQPLEDYVLRLRALRSLTTLLDHHGVPWRADSSLTLDASRDCLVESVGPSRQPASVTEHVHSSCGLVAWTLIDDGRQINLYPLSGRSVRHLRSDFEARGLVVRRSPDGVCYDPGSLRLRPAAA